MKMTSSKQQQDNKTITHGLPKTMKVAIATGFGAIEDNIFVEEQWPMVSFPSPPTQPPKVSKKKRSTNGVNDDGSLLLIKVLACAIAPGDVRVLSGNTDYMQMPESGHPYVIGSDVSGIVVAIQPSSTATETTASRFSVGDYVVSRFEEPKPNGGVAEYRIVKTCLTEKCPSSIPPTVACGLPATAMTAKRIVTDHMKKNNRVLVIGGSGAVGSCVLQYCKLYGCSYLVAVSTQKEQCERYGADRVINYKNKEEGNWWEIPEFQNADEDKFDVVYDLVNGINWTKGGLSGKAIKPGSKGGLYIALLSGVETDIVAHNIFDAMQVVFDMVGRMLWSRLHPNSLPTWIPGEGLGLEENDLAELFQDVVEKRLIPVVDPASPFDFTEQGVRKAMELQKSRHAHGKVVIKISDE